MREQAEDEHWDEAYRRYQAELANRFLIPTLARWSVPLQGRKLLEAGCGDGGCAAEFHRAGCLVTAVDIDERLVAIAARVNEREGLPIKTYVADICRDGFPGLADGPFDIVVLRDVAEHLADLTGTLGILCASLAPGGVIFSVFPPYYSPYGAHQQILPRRRLGFIPYNKLPWIQLLPDALFAAFTRGDDPRHAEVARLRDIRLTIRGFERSARQAELRVKQRRFYLSRPTFKLRYGWPVLNASLVGRIPLLNELLVTGCYYLLERAGPAD